MKIRNVVLVTGLVLLNISPFVKSFCQVIPPPIESEGGRVIFYEDIVAVHDKRIAERIEMLKNQSLDETFTYLLENQQYFFPGYHPPGMSPMKMEKLLSTRSFLKVFQQLDVLSKEEAIQTLHKFCQQAIMRYDGDLSNAKYEDKLTFEEIQERKKVAEACAIVFWSGIPKKWSKCFRIHFGSPRRIWSQ